MHRSLTAVFFLTALFSVAAELPPRPTPSIRQVEGSPLAYTPDGAGNTVIDFSHAGYAGGGEPIPFVSAKFTVAPSSLSAPNDRARIQAALDAVATLPVGPDGFRGAVLLAPGRYTIDGTLRLNASGVVLRGSGQGVNENDPTATWAMAAPGSAYLVYSLAGEPVELDLTADRATYTVAWLDSANAELRSVTTPIAGGKSVTLTPPASGTADAKRPWGAWLTRRP